MYNYIFMIYDISSIMSDSPRSDDHMASSMCSASDDGSRRKIGTSGIPRIFRRI